MKITQEVRDFAAKQDAGVLNSTPIRPEPVEGRSSGAPIGNEVAAEQGMAEMSERYREGGNELYIGANGREHD